jgi:hypothetical protein
VLTLAEGKRAKVEVMAQAPLWLLSRWIEVGERLGAWNLNPPMGVINHVLVPGGRDNVLKSGIMKIYKWWHWDVNTVLLGPVPGVVKVSFWIVRWLRNHQCLTYPLQNVTGSCSDKCSCRVCCVPYSPPCPM